jgi:hypothetical protein
MGERMSDLVPDSIWKNMVLWVLAARDTKQPCQITLHVNGEGKVVQADKIVKERVAAT